MKELWEWQGHKVAWKVENHSKNSDIAIVLIHGFGASKEHWRYNQENIGLIAPCYALDLIGFGESSQPKSQLLYENKSPKNFNYCFDNWSQQVFDFCNNIVKKPVFLIGNSIGGVIALNTSKKLSKQCLGIILIDCAQRTMDDKRLAEQSLLMRFLRPLIKTFVRQRFLSSNIFKKAANPLFHKFVVFSIIDDNDSVVPSYAQCNNCSIIHKVVDLCNSEIVKGKEQLASLPTITDIKLEFPDSLSELLESYKSDITIWQHAQFILRAQRWGEKIIIQREEDESSVQGKILTFISPIQFRMESFQEDNDV